ncbi:MAG: glycosyl hydrolase [Acidobacteriota bacterium]
MRFVLRLTCGAALACAAGVLLSAQANSTVFSDLKPRSIGPATTSGRISALDVAIDNPRIMYIGAAGGGVWKSVNGGTTFRPVFDEHVMSIGAITIDQAKPDTVWVGTGESWVRNSVGVGRGVFRSTDAGQSWKSMGLEDTERIAKVVVHPRQSDTVWVCALGHLWNGNDERGVFKTTDGGKTWSKTLFVNADTGCADMAIDPQEPDTLYAAMWQVRRLPYFFTSGGPGSGLFKSTDGGKTWSRSQRGLPQGDLGRIGLALAPSRPTTLYALVESKETVIYRSDDGAESWRRPAEADPGFLVRARPFYFSNIEVDPTDHQRLYVPNLYLSVSSNGARSFETLGLGGAVHPDHHALWINPKDPQHLVLATDGGVYISRDRGGSFTFAAAIPVGQFYHVTIDQQQPYRVYGGLQDNGSWSGPSRVLGAGAIRNRDWINVGIGDGFNVFADSRDPSLVFSEYQGGQIRRLNLRTGEMKDIRPHEGAGDPEFRFNWNSAFAAGPNDPAIMYLGAQFLFRSRDRGDTWERISGDLTTNDPAKLKQKESGGLTPDNTTAENYCTIITVAESPLEPGVIWAGTDDGNVQVTRDNGRTWTNVVKNIPGLPANTWVSMIEAGRQARGVAFATFDGHRSGDMAPHVFTTTDYGRTWKSISNGLDGFAHAIRQDLVKPDLLFAGTEFGLFVSIDHGASWSRMTGLPKVAVHDLVIHPRERDLVIATHGRGMQILDDITPLRSLDPATLEKTLAVLPSRPAFQSVPAVLQDFPGDAEYSAPNPPGGAYVSYFLKSRHIFGTLKVEILDSAGKVVETLPAGSHQGINRVYWNMRLPAPKSAAAPGLGARALVGPMVPEGKYTVRVTRGDEVANGSLELLPDPLGNHPPAARQQRQKLLLQLYSMQADLAYVADATAGVRDGLRARAAVLRNRNVAGEAATAAESLAGELDALHKTLVDRTGVITAADPQLREHVVDLYSSVLSYGGAPTTSQVHYTSVLSSQLEARRKSFEELTSRRLEGVNTALKTAGENPVRVPTREELETRQR